VVNIISRKQNTPAIYATVAAVAVGVYITRLIKDNNFTICYFTNVSVFFIAFLVLHFYVWIGFNNETRYVVVWFFRLVQTVCGIAAVQPVVRRTSSRKSVVQSDEVRIAII